MCPSGELINNTTGLKICSEEAPDKPTPKGKFGAKNTRTCGMIDMPEAPLVDGRAGAGLANAKKSAEIAGKQAKKAVKKQANDSASAVTKKVNGEYDKAKGAVDAKADAAATYAMKQIGFTKKKKKPK